MAEPGLREKKKLRLHERILDVCGGLFRAQGFDETTIDQIAEECEISRQTFFNYFGSKEAALRALGLRWLQEQAVLPGRGIDAMATMSPFDVIRTGLRAQLEAIERDRDFMRLVFTRSGLLFPSGAHVGTEADSGRIGQTQDVFRAVAALMRAGQQAGAIRDDVPAEQAAEIYVSVMLVTIRLWLQGYWGSDDGLTEHGMRALRVLEDGLRTQLEPVGQTGATPPTPGGPTDTRSKARGKRR